MTGNAIVGLNAYHGDAAAVVVDGDGLIGAVEEERFRRVKHWAGYPEMALQWCLEEARKKGHGPVTTFAVSRQPRAYFWRKVGLALRNPRSLARAAGRLRNLGQISSLEDRLRETLGPDAEIRVVPVEHHLAHLASAFFCCPWEEAMCLSVDGFGDFVSTMSAIGRGNRIEILDRVHFPHSLGLFYTAMTQYLGFPRYGDEYKVMGLAAHGEPSLVGKVGQLVPELDDGRFALDLRYFRHLREGVDMTWDDGEPVLAPVYSEALAELLGAPPRSRDDELGQFHKDLAASVQAVYEQRFFALVRALQARTGLRRLVLAGGCGMNSLANGRAFEHTDIEDLWVQPAAGDAGTALGAALWALHGLGGRPRDFVMEHAYWGPEFAVDAEALSSASGTDVVVETDLDQDVLIARAVEAIDRGEVVALYQGRSEWGPRALGNRSILADPRRTDMRELLNRKIKLREPFRPFAPSVLEEAVDEWFEVGTHDRFMTSVFPVRAERRAQIPAVTHADGTGRVQVVSRETNPLYWKLIDAFRERTGVPLLLNTSFNENEPIVNRPEEALDCFARTQIDHLILGRSVISRSQLTRPAAEAGVERAVSPTDGNRY